MKSINKFPILFVSVVMAAGCVKQIKPESKDGPVAIEKIDPLNEAPVVEEEASFAIGGPQVVTGEAIPSVGVILGPGAMKTYAHLGILQSLSKSRVPIDYIVGIGWGAPIAALYASQGQAFDVEWKMLKLDPEVLPKPGLLTKSIKPSSVNDLDGFLKEIFAQTELETSKIPFACPIRSVYSEEVRWVENGRTEQVIRSCMATLPYFKPHERQYGALTAVRESAQKLRQMGAQIVIFVNVLKEGVIFPKDRIEDEFVNHVMWTEVKTSVRSQVLGVNDVVAIHSRDLSLISSDKLRDYLRLGKEAGEAAATQLVEKYGF